MTNKTMIDSRLHQLKNLNFQLKSQSECLAKSNVSEYVAPSATET